MNKKRISTITPCFRMEKYLKKFLEELPNQTVFDDMELVLDLNEPTKEEVQWCEDFQKKYPDNIVMAIQNPVQPYGVSMNTCIALANADILTIWNVDDLRTPDSLEKQLKVFDSYPSIGLVHGNFTIVNKFGDTEGKYIDHTMYNNKQEQLRSMVIGPFFAFRREVLAKSGKPDEQFKTGSDFDLAIRLAASTEVGMAKGSLGYYLDEGKGLSTRGDGRQPIERTAIELRYGILDKVDVRYLNDAMKYDLRHVHVDGTRLPLHTFLSNYEEICKNNDLRSL